MKKINLTSVPATEARSPKGRFRVYSDDDLTAIHLTNGDRLVVIPFPFEMKLIRLPPRAANGHFRSRFARWVFY